MTDIDTLGTREVGLGKDVVRFVKRQMLDDRTLMIVSRPSSRRKLVVHKDNLIGPALPVITLEGERQHAGHMGQPPAQRLQVFAPPEGTARLYVRNVTGEPARSATLTGVLRSGARRQVPALTLVSTEYLGVGECCEVGLAPLEHFRNAAITQRLREIRLRAFRATHMAGEPLLSEKELAVTRELQIAYSLTVGDNLRQGALLVTYRPSSDRWERYRSLSGGESWLLR